MTIVAFTPDRQPRRGDPDNAMTVWQVVLRLIDWLNLNVGGGGGSTIKVTDGFLTINPADTIRPGSGISLSSSALGEADLAVPIATDLEIVALAALVSAADRLPYFTGSGSAALTTFTAFARTLLDDIDAATMRGTLSVPPTTRLVSAGTGLTGGGDLSADRTISLPNTGPGATGPIGDATHTPAVTIDAQGRVTALTSVVITGVPPGGAAGGDLAGTYPNPTVALLAITDAKVAAANKDGLVAVPSMRTLGTGALQACAGNDARLSDSRQNKGNGGTGTVATGVDTYIAGSSLAITGLIKAGSVLKWRFTLTKSAAGLVAPIWNVRVGTAGSTADTSRLTFTSALAQTAVIDTGWFDLEIEIISVSATGTIVGAMRMAHSLATTGLQTVAQDQIFTATSGTFDMTVASLLMGVSVNPGLNGVFTFKTVNAMLVNPSV